MSEHESDPEPASRRLAAIDERIRRANATATHGPPTDWSGLDVESLVERWREVQAKREP